jgi:predicted aspartyl protease
MRRALFSIGLSVLALAGSSPPASAACTLRKIAELPVSMTAAGPTVPLKINGVDARLVADSGAFFSMLTPEAARRLGLPPSAMPRGAIVGGVGGRARVRVATAKEMTVADAPFRNVDFLVGGANALPSADGLLGESFLDKLDVEYDLGHGVIRLFRNEGCGPAALIYWNGGQPYSTLKIERRKFGPHDIEARVTINGAEVHAILDTGAGRSILTEEAAARAGVRPDDPGVRPAGFVGGIGAQPRATWIGRFDSFAIGDEQVSDARLLFGELQIADADMLLGADFFLSHRVLVANSQQRIYFTRNEGAPAQVGMR